MGPVEALKIALSKEIGSIELYQNFLKDYPAAKEIFLFLVNEEQNHKQLIEKKIAELTKY